MAEWNKEKLTLWFDYGDMGFLYRFKELIEEVKTPFQTIRVLRHSNLGKVILLDEDIMTSDKDEEYDRAIISLVPPNARQVLILGGGDGSLADKLQHRRNIRGVTMVEIDEQVPRVFRKHFPVQLGKKVRTIIGNAFEYQPDVKPDVVIDDMYTEPINARGNYYKDLADKFQCPIISQTDSRNNNAEQIIEKIKSFARHTKTVEAFVPTYLENWTFTRYD